MAEAAILSFRRRAPLPAVVENRVQAPPFREVVQEWFDFKTSSGRWCPLVQENVKRFIRHWNELFGEVPVNEVTTAQVEGLEKERAATGIVESSLNLEGSYLRSCFRWTASHREWEVDENPAKNWEHRPEIVRKEYSPLSAEQEALFCARAIAIGAAWLVSLVVFAIATGLRQGTIRKLRVSMVRRRLVQEREAVFLEIPATIMKAKKDHRVPLTPKALEALGNLDGRQPDELIFNMPSKSVISYWFKAVVLKVQGLSRCCSFHDCRRTFVARLSAKGVPMHVVMKLGAWSRPTTMLNHYCSLTDEEALRVMEKV